MNRHSVVIGFGVVCFTMSAFLILTLPEKPNIVGKADRAARTPTEVVALFFHNMKVLGAEEWFRKFIVNRLSFVVTGLSVPFYALMAAAAHHSSSRGLTALVVSSAAALLVAAPMWRSLSVLSNRTVMLVSTCMILLTGVALIAFHYSGFDHGVEFHSLTLFVVTVAVTGLGTSRSLYFMQSAPKSQRVEAQALAATLS